MDSFELIISQLLEEEGYWTVVNYKVPISQQDAEFLGKPSMPTPDIDILAYKPKENIIYLLEVKSYLDSYGVRLKDLSNLKTKNEGHYKLLTWEKYRLVLIKLVKKNLSGKGLINTKNLKIRFGLIAGNIYPNTLKEEDFKNLFEKAGYKNWWMWGPETIKVKVMNLAIKGYEDNAVTMISKILNPEAKIKGLKKRKEIRHEKKVENKIKKKHT